MVDTVTTTTTMGTDNDDWEVAVDTGEFDKRLEQQEKARAANQEPTISTVSSIVNDDDSRTSSNINFMNSNKPIRILKRPTSQCQLPTNNDVTNSLIAATTTASTAALNNNNNTNNSNSSFSTNISSSTTVPVVSIIPRTHTKDSTNSSQSITTPVFSSSSLSSQSTKPAIKTYEQRELEYRLARLRIMGEEESSAKDDDDIPVVESTPVPTDDTTKPITLSSTSSTIRTTNKMSGVSQQPLQCHSTPGSYASNLYTLTDAPSNTGTIHFTPNNTNTTTTTNSNNSTPNLGTGPYSSPNFPQHYRGAYPTPYSHMPPPPLIPRYPLAATTTTTLYMTSTAPFVSAPSSSSSSSVSSSYHMTPQQHQNMTTNNWYHYQNPQTPYGTQQYGHPQ
ncbi:unnamed protein product [Rotaria sordida]|uniref:SUZ domain-containing protein n=1 Tax=Rotaria sordida TaxID=392033 RepID=A0A818JHL9_9BILA|nr:unnamed protein product [Rotaria sordida]